MRRWWDVLSVNSGGADTAGCVESGIVYAALDTMGRRCRGIRSIEAGQSSVCRHIPTYIEGISQDDSPTEDRGIVVLQAANEGVSGKACMAQLKYMVHYMKQHNRMVGSGY